MEPIELLGVAQNRVDGNVKSRRTHTQNVEVNQRIEKAWMKL